MSFFSVFLDRRERLSTSSLSTLTVFGIHDINIKDR